MIKEKQEELLGEVLIEGDGVANAYAFHRAMGMSCTASMRCVRAGTDLVSGRYTVQARELEKREDVQVAIERYRHKMNLDRFYGRNRVLGELVDIATRGMSEEGRKVLDPTGALAKMSDADFRLIKRVKKRVKQGGKFGEEIEIEVEFKDVVGAAGVYMKATGESGRGRSRTVDITAEQENEELKKLQEKINGREK